MDADLVIGVLKVASALIGGALGVAALFANYRDPSGGLTRAGMAVLAGIVASAIVGTVTSIIETNKARRSALEQAERAEVLLREVSRSILPIRQVKLTYWIEIPRGIANVDKYLERLSESIEKKLLEKPSRDPAALREVEPVKGLASWVQDENGEILRAEIEKGSDLWPGHDNHDEALLANAPDFFPLSIHIFKEPIRPEGYRPLSDESDFQATSDEPEEFSYEWNRTTKRLLIRGTSDFDKASWSSNGKIASIVDLYGAQILLPPNRFAETELARSMNFIGVIFDFGEGRSLWLTARQFVKTTDRGGRPIFSVTLPKKEAEFTEFVKLKPLLD